MDWQGLVFSNNKFLAILLVEILQFNLGGIELCNNFFVPNASFFIGIRYPNNLR
jgi:hypothetical protein